jgi:hypothetical protein
MKVSGLANEVIAAPANAEQRLLKVCASVAEKKICFTFILLVTLTLVTCQILTKKN